MAIRPKKILRQRAADLSIVTEIPADEIHEDMVRRQQTPGEWAQRRGLDPLTFQLDEAHRNAWATLSVDGRTPRWVEVMHATAVVADIARHFLVGAADPGSPHHASLAGAVRALANLGCRLPADLLAEQVNAKSMWASDIETVRFDDFLGQWPQERLDRLCQELLGEAKIEARAPVEETTSVADELKKLDELRTSGVLTDEEFAAQKDKLLRG